jgi:hypothetical protein
MDLNGEINKVCGSQLSNLSVFPYDRFCIQIITPGKNKTTEEALACGKTDASQ